MIQKWTQNHSTSLSSQNSPLCRCIHFQSHQNKIFWSSIPKVANHSWRHSKSPTSSLLALMIHQDLLNHNSKLLCNMYPHTTGETTFTLIPPYEVAYRFTRGASFSDSTLKLQSSNSVSFFPPLKRKEASILKFGPSARACAMNFVVKTCATDMQLFFQASDSRTKEIQKHMEDVIISLYKLWNEGGLHVLRVWQTLGNYIEQSRDLLGNTIVSRLYLSKIVRFEDSMNHDFFWCMYKYLS